MKCIHRKELTPEALKSYLCSQCGRCYTCEHKHRVDDQDLNWVQCKNKPWRKACPDHCDECRKQRLTAAAAS